MSVWLCMPSKRPLERIEPLLRLWRNAGYSVAIQRDPEDIAVMYANVIFRRPYAGYAEAVNYIAGQVLMMEPDAEWIVCAGDDTEPDAAHSAEELSIECKMHFYNPNLKAEGPPQPLRPQGSNLWTETFGVMQPTGDRWGEHRNTHQFTARPGQGQQMCSQCGRFQENVIHSVGAYIDRVAGSPWMGREFCLRVNQGRGPLWPEYFHIGCDEELQAVAKRLGVFWQRPDLIHLHRHWGRDAGKSNMPEFLKRANSTEEWNAYKKLFTEREAKGFPGSEPL